MPRKKSKAELKKAGSIFATEPCDGMPIFFINTPDSSAPGLRGEALEELMETLKARIALKESGDELPKAEEALSEQSETNTP